MAKEPTPLEIEAFLARFSEKKVIVPESQLRQVLDERKQFESDTLELIALVRKIVILLGIADEKGNIRPQILSQEESALKYVLKSLGGMMKDMMIHPKKMERDLEFVKNIIPVLLRYVGK